MVLDRVIKPTVVFVEFAEVYKVERLMTSIIFVTCLTLKVGQRSRTATKNSSPTPGMV